MRFLPAGLLITGAILASHLWAQRSVSRPVPSPLLYVRLDSAPNVHATVYQGASLGRDLEMPVRLGLRPGYVYRIKLSGFPGRPGLLLCPTIEVRGTLWFNGKLNPADHPAPLNITEDDVARVAAGSVLTKVILLEDPDRAVPEPSTRDRPLELDVSPGTDPMLEARARGRPVLVVHLGERELGDDELVRQSIQGTVLFPGERSLAPPAAPPSIPSIPRVFYDPILGPRIPLEECLYDGGDSGIPAGIDAEGRAGGVDPSDTVAAFTDSGGRRHLAVSNRVCVCVPRFLVLRNEVQLGRIENVTGPGQASALAIQSGIRVRQPAYEAGQAEELAGLRARERASATTTTVRVDRLVRLDVLSAAQMDIGPATALGTDRVRLLSAGERLRLTRQAELARALTQPAAGPKSAEQVMAGPAVVGIVGGIKVIAEAVQPRDLTVSCERDIRLPDRPLLLHKWADRQSAQIGDVVTFYLKYSNLGGRPISDVAISDSLTGRLEYVAGSASSDHDAVFTTQANEAGSALLHWEIRGPLAPGDSGVVRFQARVR